MKNEEYLETKRVHPLIFGIITNGLATYRECMKMYSLDEIFDLCEILIVKRENELISFESQKGSGDE